MSLPFQQQIEMLNALVSAQRLTVCIGSGVSRSRLPLLDQLITLALQNIPLSDEARQTFRNYSIVHHFRAVLAAEGVTTSEPCTLEEFRAQSAVRQANLCQPLVSNYGEVFTALETVSGGKRALLDYLEFEQFDTSDADAAHFYIGYLILEGVIYRLLTTNWDHLVESAVTITTSRPIDSVLDVIIDEASWLDRNPGISVSVAKIHGCSTQYPGQCESIILTTAELQRVTADGWQKDAVAEFLSGTVLFSGYSGSDYTVMVPFRVLADLRAENLLENPSFFIAQESDLNPAERDLTHNEPYRHIRLWANDTFASLYFAYLRQRLEDAIGTAGLQRRPERAFPNWEESVWQAVILRLRTLISEDLGSVLDTLIGEPGARTYDQAASQLPIQLSAMRTIFLSGKLTERGKYHNLQFDNTKDIVLLILLAAFVDLVRSVAGMRVVLETTHVGITIVEADGSRRKVLFLYGTYPTAAYHLLSSYLTEVENSDGSLPEFEVAVVPCSRYDVPGKSFPTSPILGKTLHGAMRARRRFIDPVAIFSTRSYDELVATLRIGLEL